MDLVPNSRLARVLLALAVVGVFFAFAVPMILHAGPLDRAGFDQINFHEPAIRIFAHDWVHRREGMDFKNYLSATTPGYHVALAFVARFVSDSTTALQLAGSLFTAGLLGVLTYWNAERVPLRLALATSLCVLASRYVFFPGVWLLPDNAGWLGVLCVLALVMDRRTSVRTLMLGAVALSLTVLVRQTHIWAAGLLVLGFIWPKTENVLEISTLSDDRVEPPGLVQRLLWGAAACVPAVMILSSFHHLWGGLTPPLFQYQYPNAGNGLAKLNLAAPAYLLAILGLYAPFFAVSWLTSAIRVVRSHTLVAVATLALTLALVIVPSTAYSADQSLGRWEGLWALAGKFPNIAGHTSVLMLGLALLGSASLLGFFARLPRRDGALVLTALAGFSSTQAVAFQLWQRYHEPLVLIVLGVLACRAHAAGGGGMGGGPAFERGARRFAHVGPLVLALLLASMTAFKVARSKVDHKLSPDQLMSDLFPTAPKSLTPRMEP
jgi:hypothetical protein